MDEPEIDNEAEVTDLIKEFNKKMLEAYAKEKAGA